MLMRSSKLHIFIDIPSVLAKILTFTMCVYSEVLLDNIKTLYNYHTEDKLLEGGKILQKYLKNNKDVFFSLLISYLFVDFLTNRWNLLYFNKLQSSILKNRLFIIIVLQMYDF